MKVQALEDFDDPFSVENSTNFERGLTTVEPQWLEEFEGRTGVVTSVNGDDNSWADYAFRFNMTQEQLAEIDFAYISIWVWLDSDVSVTLNQRNIPYAVVPGKTWTEIRLTPDMIAGGADMSWFMDANLMLEGETARDTFDRLMTQKGGFNLFGQGSGADKSITVYVDEITYMRNYHPVLVGETEYEMGEEVLLATEIEGVTDYVETFTVIDPLGEEVQLTDGNRFTPTVAGEYTVTAEVFDENGIGSEEFVIRAFAERSIVVGEFTQEPVAGDTVAVPEAHIVDKDGVQTDDTVNISVTRYGKEIALTDGEFLAADGGKYEVKYSFTYEGTEIVSVLHIDVGFPAAEQLPNNLAGAVMPNSSFLAKDAASGFYFEDEGETIVLYAKHAVGTSVEMIDFKLPDTLDGAGGYRYSFRVKIGNYQAENAFFQVRLRDADNTWTDWGQSHQGSVVFGNEFVTVSGYIACAGDPGYLSIELYTGAVLSGDEEVIVRLNGLSVEKSFETQTENVPEGILGTAAANSYLMRSDGAIFFEKDGEEDVVVVEFENLAGAYPALQFTFAQPLSAGQYTFRVQMKAENYTHQDITMVLLNGSNAVATAYPAWGDKTAYSVIEYTFTVNSEITAIRFDLTPSSIADSGEVMRWWIKTLSYEEIVPSFVQQTENLPQGILGTAQANSYLAEGTGSLIFEKDGEDDVVLIEFVNAGSYPAVQFELPSALVAGKYTVSVEMKAENYTHTDIGIVLLGNGTEIGWKYPAWGDKSQYSVLQAEFEVGQNLTSIRFDLTPSSISDPSRPMKWWIKNISVEAVAPFLCLGGVGSRKYRFAGRGVLRYRHAVLHGCIRIYR